jgi:hypothetical protein
VGSTDQERTTHENRQSVCDSNVGTRSGGKASPTYLGTKVKSDATLIRVETDNGLTGIGAALGTPPIVAAIVEHELAAECVGEDPLFSERIYEKMYSGSRSRPALDMMPVAVTCGKCRVQTGKPRKASFVLRGDRWFESSLLRQRVLFSSALSGRLASRRRRQARDTGEQAALRERPASSHRTR